MPWHWLAPRGSGVPEPLTGNALVTIDGASTADMMLNMPPALGCS
jgi:hypothetical protein